jgi:hypothetical protein
LPALAVGIFLVKMVKTIGACMGLLSIEITSEEDDAPLITKEQNAETRTFVMEKWMFGPEKTKANNSEYWRDIICLLAYQPRSSQAQPVR